MELLLEGTREDLETTLVIFILDEISIDLAALSVAAAEAEIMAHPSSFDPEFFHKRREFV